MIDVTLELKLDAFLVNSMGKAEDISSQMSARALRLSCERVTGARRLAENKPTADFEFLSDAGEHVTQTDVDAEFEGKLFNYLKTHTTVDTSRVNIASGESGYLAAQKGTSSGEIGRMYLAELPNQSSLALELVFKPEEFDAVWNLLTQQHIRKLVANLRCFKLMPGAYVGLGQNLFVAGVLSCSLQLAPND